MGKRNRIIIDTDPVSRSSGSQPKVVTDAVQGVDDILALLFAFASKPEELEVVLISVTFGNVDVQKCVVQ